MRFVQLTDVEQDRAVYVNPAAVAEVYASKEGDGRVSVLVMQGAPTLKVAGAPPDVIAKLAGAADPGVLSIREFRQPPDAVD